MTDEIRREEQSEKPEEKSCFPVTKEVATGVLDEIAWDPWSVYYDEGALIGQINPLLNQLLNEAEGIEEWHVSSLREGALWAHRILRKQAEERGVELPTVSEDTCTAYIQDIEDIHQTLKERLGKGGRVWFPEDWERQNLQLKELYDQEPNLGEVLNEMVKYRTERESFLYGVTLVYFPIKKTVDAERMGRKLGYS